MNARAGIRPVPSPKRETLVAVCRQCSGDGAALRAALKRAFKQRGCAKSVRVVKTSCLDICPKRGVAVAVADARVPESGARYFSVTADADPAVVAAALRP